MCCRILLLLLCFFTNSIQAQVPVFHWAQYYSGTGTGFDIVLADGISTDVHGNIYTSGGFYGTVDFDPGPSYTLLTSKGTNASGYITKTSPLGKLLWVKQFASDEEVGRLFVTSDKTDGIFITGMFSGKIDCDPGPGITSFTSSGNNNFIVKLDTNGKFIWAKAIDNTWGHMGPLKVILDQNQDLLLSGSFSGGKPDMDPGTPVVNLPGSSCGGDEYFILKLDHDGNYVWVKRAGERCHPILTKAIAVDSKNNLYIAGTVFGTQDFDPDTGKYILPSAGSYDLFIAKLDSSGKLLKAISAGSMRTDHANGIAIDKADNIYITGVYADNIDFDPGADSLILHSDGLSAENIFIARYDTGLAVQWAKSFSVPPALGHGYGQGMRIAADRNCNITAVGLFSGKFDFDPGPDTALMTGTGNMFISRLDSAGKYIWSGELSGAGTEDGMNIHADAFDNIYTCGSFVEKADFDPSEDTAYVTPVQMDGFLHKLSICYPYDTVDIAACRSYTLEGHKYEVPGTYTQTITTERKCALTLTFNLMLEDVNDTVIRSGNVLSAKGTGTAYQWVRCPSFVPISGATAPVFTVVSDGDYALVITKGSCTDTSDCINVSKTGLADIVSGNHAIQLRPNPAQTQTTISFTEAVQQAQIELQTITGITVHKEADFSGKEITVDLQEYPTGLYLVIIKQAGAPVMTMKLLKQ